MVQVIGWLGLVASVLVIYSGVVGLMTGMSLLQLLSVLLIVMGIVMLFWSSEVKRYKKWAWYFGIIWYGMGIVYFVYNLFAANFNITTLLGILYPAVVIAVLFSQKKKFFGETAPEVLPVNTPENPAAANLPGNPPATAPVPEAPKPDLPPA